MTNAKRKHRLLETNWPVFGEGSRPAAHSAIELESRITALRHHMSDRKLTHVVVYADREHFGNLAYLTGFDPRFEEALMVISLGGKPLIIVGNECQSYLPISPLVVEGRLRVERFQTFSLLSQPRDSSRGLLTILGDEGIGKNAKVGCAGWKYFTEAEHPDALHALDLPSYIADNLRELAGREHVINVNDIFMHPGYGLRSFCTATDIAYFEYTNAKASEALKRMIFGLREGMIDYSVVELARMDGEPLGCHPTFCTGRSAQLGLAGPSGQKVQKGEPLAANISYYGSNICRAAWIAESANDLPRNAVDYVSNFAGPYFEAMQEWFSLMKPGVPGGQIWSMIHDRLPFEQFGIFLNPGHLIHLDEWISSPVYQQSDVPLHSGMAIQVDVIPSSASYFSTRMEDGIVLADATLRQQVQEAWPECYERCQNRRSFMQDILGIDLPAEVLPLSNISAIVSPFLLRPEVVIALEP